MGLIIRIISHPEGESIQQWQYNFPEEGGVIGRSIGVTLQLNDNHRTISGIHATIKKTARGYQITDNSVNGVFINNADSPLGKDNSITLNDGDTVRIADYQLLISCFDFKKETINSPAENFNEINTDDDNNFILDRKELSFGKTLFDDDPFDDNLNIEVNNNEPKTYPDEKIVHSSDHFDINMLANKDIIEDKPNFDIFTPEMNVLSEPIEKNNKINLDPLALLFNEKNITITDFIKMINDAVESAIGKLLLELSPDLIEKTYFSLLKPGFFNNTPDFWTSYKNYYYMQVENQNWDNKFKSYFHSDLFTKIIEKTQNEKKNKCY
nr:FHA domain-containing protein [uncultured Moellerella sp.]